VPEVTVGGAESLKLSLLGSAGMVKFVSMRWWAL